MYCTHAALLHSLRPFFNVYHGTRILKANGKSECAAKGKLSESWKWTKSLFKSKTKDNLCGKLPDFWKPKKNTINVPNAIVPVAIVYFLLLKHSTCGWVLYKRKRFIELATLEAESLSRIAPSGESPQWVGGIMVDGNPGMCMREGALSVTES